jgi:hypothetical protein
MVRLVNIFSPSLAGSPSVAALARAVCEKTVASPGFAQETRVGAV